jgi:Domain of unknown function (DUF4157)
MNSTFTRASRARATAARITTDAGFSPGSVPARSASGRLRPSQQPTGVPIRGAVIQSGGIRPSQIAVVRSGVSTAIPSISSAACGPSAGVRPSRGGLLREGDGTPRLRIQRCGVGSSCDCAPRDKLAGIEHDLHRATSGGGTPLPATSQERMESAFSSDFAAVRVHTGAAAQDAASALGARALTAGTDILFRAGEYLPGTPGGDRLLAHELAHVVQQAHGLAQGILDTGATGHLEKAAGLAADHASPAAEREAHGAAMIAAMGEPVPALSRQPPAIARQDDFDAGIPEAATQSDASISDTPSDPRLPGGVGTSPPDVGTGPPDAGPTDAGAADAATHLPLPGTLQAKLVIGEANDPLEGEADRIADRVLRISQPPISATPSQIRRKCAACEEEEAQTVRRKRTGPEGAACEAPPVVTELLRSPGRPLETGVRRSMEQQFRQDLGDVRIHTDAMASRSAEAVAARAYTVGRNVVFRHGEYAPNTHGGRRLLAHELVHVLQQRPLTGSAPGAGFVATLRRACDQPESFYQASGNYCLDTTFSPSTHPGKNCYRELIPPESWGCPSGNHCCFAPDGTVEDSWDTSRLADGKDDDGSCSWDWKCVIAHTVTDYIPAVLSPFTCLGKCANTPAPELCMDSCVNQTGG